MAPEGNLWGNAGINTTCGFLGNKAVGFIDGNNFYHTAKKNQLPYRRVDFSKIMKFVCEKCKLTYGGFYYYNSVPDLKRDEKIYYEQMAYFDVVRHMDKNLDVMPRKLRYSSAQEILERYHQKKQNLEALGLCDNCKKKVDSACFNCVMEKSKREKGVDVKIAIDIVQKALDDEYDACILFSGDADFVPALQLIQKQGKQAISSFIRCKGYSWELRQKIKYVVIEKETFNNLLLSH